MGADHRRGRIAGQAQHRSVRRVCRTRSACRAAPPPCRPSSQGPAASGPGGHDHDRRPTRRRSAPAGRCRASPASAARAMAATSSFATARRLRMPPQDCDQAGDAKGAGIENLPRARRCARLGQFIAAGKDRHAGPRAHRQRAPRRTQPPGQRTPSSTAPCSSKRAPAREIDPPPADIWPACARRGTSMRSPSRLTSSWITMASAPSGSGGAGRNADGGARFAASCKAMTGGGFADHVQTSRRVGAAHRIAVHGGGRERRLVARGHDGLRQDAAQGGIKRRLFAAKELDRRQHEASRLGHVQQPLGRAGPLCHVIPACIKRPAKR